MSTDTTQQAAIDSIQRDIWRGINQEAIKRGIKYSIGDAYILGSAIKEVLHPRVEALIEAAATQRAIEAMEQAKSRVLRRTEIPADAKNPTRDHIVILGEEIADIISRDIEQLQSKLTQTPEGGSDD